MDLTTLTAAEAEQQADQAQLARIAANIADISEVAASRVTQRIESRMRKRGSYIGQLVTEVRKERANLVSDADQLQGAIDGERDNIDELRLLRRLDEITREESDKRIESARETVRAARDELREINRQLAAIDEALAPYTEESEQ